MTCLQLFYDVQILEDSSLTKFATLPMFLHLLIKKNNDENKVSQSLGIMQIGRG